MNSALPAVIALVLGLGLAGMTHGREEKSQGTLRYVSRVGGDETAEIKSRAGRYNVQIVTAKRTGSYLADVQISIKRSREVVLETTLDGPILLVDLRPSIYTVRAVHKGKLLERSFDDCWRTAELGIHLVAGSPPPPPGPADR